MTFVPLTLAFFVVSISVLAHVPFLLDHNAILIGIYVNIPAKLLIPPKKSDINDNIIATWSVHRASRKKTSPNQAGSLQTFILLRQTKLPSYPVMVRYNRLPGAPEGVLQLHLDFSIVT
jgi:hypothetical protein